MNSGAPFAHVQMFQTACHFAPSKSSPLLFPNLVAHPTQPPLPIQPHILFVSFVTSVQKIRVIHARTSAGIPASAAKPIGANFTFNVSPSPKTLAATTPHQPPTSKHALTFPNKKLLPRC
jgi:hypothetical protein